jgi:Antitoxin Phd_YefM, type II toxin-antitoxin system
MSDTLPFSEVKAHLSEVADRVEREHDRIVVTRNGISTSFPARSVMRRSRRSWAPSPSVRDGSASRWLASWPGCGRRGDYRVIYEIDDDRKVVVGHRVQHRRVVYRPR